MSCRHELQAICSLITWCTAELASDLPCLANGLSTMLDLTRENPVRLLCIQADVPVNFDREGR